MASLASAGLLARVRGLWRTAAGTDNLKQEPGIGLAAFGKHPAWTDFFEHGLDTERLANIHRVLYTQGIDDNIVSGVWGDPAEEASAIVRDLHHVFMWRNAEGLCVGRCWPSEDSVGRARPMVACLEVRGRQQAWGIGNALPQLESLEARCRESTSREEVLAHLDEARQELHAAALHAQDDTADVPFVPPSLAWFAERPEMGPGHQGLECVLYQIHEMAAYAAHKAQHLRAAACDHAADNAVLRWADLLFGLVAVEIPLMIVAPVDHDWIDVVMGEPGGIDLVFLRRQHPAAPADTECEVPGDFIELVGRAVAEAKSGAVGPCFAALAEYRDAAAPTNAARQTVAYVGSWLARFRPRSFGKRPRH